MKIKNYLVYSIILCLFSCKTNVQTDYDVVIVGGGLAGLAAAKELNNKEVLVIEKDSVLGGRVRTANYQNKYYYDLGAVFAFDKSSRTQFNILYDEIVENAPIGFWLEGNLYSGNTVFDCLKQMPSLDTFKIREYMKLNELNSTELDSNLYDILNTNMKAVFPGALKEYNPVVQKFAFERYNSSHFKYGNQIITQELLRNKKFHIKMSSKVIAINDLFDKVEVLFENNNKIDTIYSKKVIVATTATVANKIIKEKSSLSKQFLNNVFYAGYYSIAVGINKRISYPDVSYLMPVNSGFASILKQQMPDDITIFQLYVAEEDFVKFSDDEDMKQKSIDILKLIWSINENDILFYDKYYWKEAGVLIGNNYLKKWNKLSLQPSKNVFLAGDYCLNDYSIPYGMIPAIESGKRAAKKIK